MHAVADRHDTPTRLLTLALAGLGVASTCQLVPFHASASVSPIPDVVP